MGKIISHEETHTVPMYVHLLRETHPIHSLSGDCVMIKSGSLSMILTRYLLDLVVTEEVQTRTQGVVRAQWNESNRGVTECVLQP